MCYRCFKLDRLAVATLESYRVSLRTDVANIKLNIAYTSTGNLVFLVSLYGRDSPSFPECSSSQTIHSSRDNSKIIHSYKSNN